MPGKNLAQLTQAVWIPLAVIVATAGVLIFKTAQHDREDRAAAASQVEPPSPSYGATTGTTGLAPVAVYEYLEFAGVIGAGVERTMSARHDYTADGLRMLATALEAVAAVHPGTVQPAVIEDLRTHAERLQEARHPGDHAAIARRAFAAAADAIGTLDPDAGTRLRKLAETIAPDRPLLDQREPVRAFFRESAAALRTVGASGQPTS